MIQFMVNVWLAHGEKQRPDPWQIALDVDDDWPERPMLHLTNLSPMSRGTASAATVRAEWQPDQHS